LGVGCGGNDPILGKNLYSENLRDASDGINKQTTTWLQGKGTDFRYMECPNIIQDWSTTIFAISVKRIRPRTRWTVVVLRDALQLLGTRGWRRRATNRDEWRRFVREAKARKGL
jgi:hypothetical protein